MRFLIVEDEKDLAHILKKGFEEEGYSVDLCFDGEEGAYMAGEIPYDCLILDILLPKINGLELLRLLRNKGISTPILMLTAKDTTMDKIKGLDTGADDYLTKPFEFGELLARVRSLLRRRATEKKTILTLRDLQIDTLKKEVKRGKTLIHLTAKEYALLEYLMYHKNRVVSRTEISQHIYDESFDLDSNIIDVFINNLRNKIDKGHPAKLIHTVRGTGYILKE